MLLDNIWRAPGPCNFFHMTEHTQRPGCAIIIFLLGTWSLLDPLIRVYLGYLSVRQRYLLPFCCCQKFIQVGNVLLCELVRQLISLGAYEPWIQVWESFENLLMTQDLVAPAQYWHDPFNQTHFLVFNNRLRCWPVLSPLIWKAVQSGSHYLADLNNEREWKNETYKEVLAGLENLVLVMWDGDTTIVPKVVFLQSHFSNYPQPSNEIIQYQRSQHILVSMPWSRTQR